MTEWPGNTIGKEYTMTFIALCESVMRANDIKSHKLDRRA